MAKAFKAGDGVHWRSAWGADKYPGTVRRATAKRVWVAPDAVRSKGDTKVYLPGARARNGGDKSLRLFTLRADGVWRSAGPGAFVLGSGRESNTPREM